MAWFKTRRQGPLSHLAVELPLALIEEGNTVVAYTPALDLSSCGSTKAEAKKMFNEAVRIFFNDLVENGTLDQVLSGLGWIKDESRASWLPPKISQESIGVRVPAAV